MAENETGWSKHFPKAQGWYWVRSGPIGLPVAVEFFPALMDRRQPMVRYPGKSGFMVAVAEEGKPEWLGPISPSDFEQLTRLRNDIEEAREVIEGLQTFWIDQGDSNPVEWHWCDPDTDCSDECQRTRALLERLAQHHTGGEKS